ncbi:MAG: TIGR01212 family radical SAM protein [Treponemataceae bacterium]
MKNLWVSDFYKEKFKCKVYKISIDGGCTCPNRDGTKGNCGCIFCSAGGSGEFTVKMPSIFEQIEEAKKLVEKKAGKKGKYIAYFQNFTNTYGDFDFITKKFNQAVEFPDIVGIAIATRPDCLSDRMLDFLKELSEKTFVQLEFGLQTSNEKTAKYIRRAYSLCEYEDTMFRVLKVAPKIHIVTHVIFGLPREKEKDMMDSIDCAVKNKTHGIKITCLHVLSGTDLEKEYREEKFKTLTQNEYIDLISNAMNHLPNEVIIHRLTGDGAKKILIAPLWTANKKKVMNALKKRLESR